MGEEGLAEARNEFPLLVNDMLADCAQKKAPAPTPNTARLGRRLRTALVGLFDGVR